MEEIKILEILTKKAEKYNVSFCGVESNAIIETVNEALSLHNVVGSYDHCNIVDVVTNKTIFTAPANRFEVKFMNVDKEVGKIQI